MNQPGPVSSETETADFVIVGSGAASMCAAVVIAEAGFKAVILEKEAVVGGSTALSAGILWIPNNPPMVRAGISDSLDDARRYLEDIAGDVGETSSAERRERFLVEGPKAISFLESQGVPFRICPEYADYHCERPGGHTYGRGIEVDIFDIGELGDWRDRLRRGWRAFPVRTSEARGLYTGRRTWRGIKTAAKLAARLMIQKFNGRVRIGSGAALQGRLLKLALQHGIDIRTEAKVVSLTHDGSRVSGVTFHQNGQTRRLDASRGVLINAGGFARNSRMRETYQPQPNSAAWTSANPGDTGEVIELAMGLGARIDLMDEAWWIVSSMRNGAPVLHVPDISKPYCILVDSAGQRYVNESASYMWVGQALYRRHKDVAAVPSWIVMDARHRAYYPLGMMPPGIVHQDDIDSGYLKKADTLEALAAACGIDPIGLRRTVETFNGFARDGVDRDFHRGERAYDNYFGDPNVKPNPNLGLIERAPFYAVAVYPGDVGTGGGLVTDAFARVTDAAGKPIDGLYAAGNSTASIMGRRYAGPGSTIGASLVEGWIASQHALGRL